MVTAYDDYKLAPMPDRIDSRWIHVDQRLPAVDSVVYVVDDDTGNIIRAEFTKDGFVKHFEQTPLPHIELWQPLI